MTYSYRVTVVIPTYRRCAAVRRLLEHLARQTTAADEYEVIVSIDGTDDSTREMAAAFRAPYALHTLCRLHGGRAAACNAGILTAKGELVVLLDDDMAPVPEFLRAHQEAHAGEPRCGVLGAVPVVVPPDAPLVAAYIAAKFNRHLEKLARPDHVFVLRDFYSGNFSIRRDLLLEVGLFDEAFKIYGNEDLDLSLRLARAGIRLRYRADALARQSYTKTFADLARDTIAKGHTAVLLAGKHPEAFHELKLATFHGASRRWRYARNALLSVSATFPPTATGVVKLVTAVERRRPRRLHLLYDFALDYLYWLGAAQALGAGGLRQLAARAPGRLPDSGGTDRPVAGGESGKPMTTGTADGETAKVWVVLPAFNEAENLPPLLEGIARALGSTPYTIVVVDDGSSDATAGVVRSWTGRLPLMLVSHPHNRGLARTIETGIRTVLDRAEPEDILVTMDADNTHPPALMPALLAEVEHGADLVIASRFVPGGAEEGVSFRRRVLSHGAGILMRWRFGLRGVRDYSCGYRAHRVRCLREATDRYGDRLIEAQGFTATAELLVKLAPFCSRISEMPLHLRYDRKRGESKMRVMRTIHGYLRLLCSPSPR